MSILKRIKKDFQAKQVEEMTVAQYLELAKSDPTVYSSPAERMLKAIGESIEIDTSKDPRLSRIFQNRIIRQYPAFNDFYGMEDAIENVVGFFRHAAQNLEESKQILYLLGPVGSAKSTLAERLKFLMQSQPIYAIKGSPLNESPLSLFDKHRDASALLEEYGIPSHRLNQVPSGWLTKRLNEANGDLDSFTVVKLYPSINNQIAIARTEPGDENNQDISSLVGKVDIRKLEKFRQDDADAYNYSGGLCLSNRGLLEFVEMFKAPIKVLHPLLTATQDRMYNGTEAIGALPYEGVILAHSNESEFEIFRNNKQNEAFLDRVYIVKVPYCLRVTDEIKIYEKLINQSHLAKAPLAPNTLEILAKLTVLSRLENPERGSAVSKMRIYDGESLKDKDPHAKTLQEYKDMVEGKGEGMKGLSTRFAFKILSKTFNYHVGEVEANPVHLLTVLQDVITAEDFSEDFKTRLRGIIKSELTPKYIEYIGREIQKAYQDGFFDFCQNQYDRYVILADHRLQEQDYRDPDTGTIFDVDMLEKELNKIEEGANIHNIKDFRYEVVNFTLRHRDKYGKNPAWNSYNKIKEVLERRLSASAEEMLPQITFGAKRTTKDEKKHTDFVKRMMDLGYTESQVRLMVEFYSRSRSV